MKNQVTFTPEVLTSCTLYNDLTLLVIYERLNFLENNLALIAMYCYLHPSRPEEGYPPLRDWFLSRFLPSHRAYASALLAVWGFRLGFCVAL